MKKYVWGMFSFLIVSITFGLMFSVVQIHASEPLTFTMSSTEGVIMNKGVPFQVDITAEGVENVVNFQMDLYYDKDFFQVINVQKGPGLFSSLTSSIDHSIGRVHVNYSDVFNKFSGDVVLFTLTVVPLHHLPAGEHDVLLYIESSNFMMTVFDDAYQQYFYEYPTLNFQPISQGMYGDTDLDHRVSILDAALIRLYLDGHISLTDLQKSLSNVTLSDNLSILDALRIQEYLAAIIDRLGPEREDVYYRIKFDSNGGSAVSNMIAPYNAAITPPSPPERAGFVFTGWHLDGVPFTFDHMPEQNITLTASWSGEVYTITFDTGEGTDIADQEYALGDTVVAPEPPTREGYTFAGWSPELPTVMPDESMTVTALWTPITYTITFNSAGGTDVSPLDVQFGETVIAPENPERIGYTFIGWDPALPATMPASHLHVTALWDPIIFTITFDSAGGSDVSPMDKAFGSPITEPDAPVRDGFSFTGWYLGDVLFTFDTMPAGNITLVAGWSTYPVITFNSHGGTSVTPIVEAPSTPIEAPVPPTKLGYTFGGWYTDESYTTLYQFEVMPEQNITVHAKWTVIEYTITFDSAGGSVVSSMTVPFGDSIIEPEAPTKTGHTFAGWSPELPSKMPAEHLHVTAQWTVIEYTITFDTEGGSEVSPMTQPFDTTIVPPSNPEKEGHTFIGWEPTLPATMPAQNLEVTAVWEVNTYTITFDSAGGSEEGPLSKPFNTPITLPVPTKEGYLFNGWLLDGVLFDAETMPAMSPLLVATWIVDPDFDDTYNHLFFRILEQTSDTLVVELVLGGEVEMTIFDIHFSYDSSILSYVEYEEGSVYASTGRSIMLTGHYNEIRLSDFDPYTTFTEEIVLVIIVFTILEPTSTVLEFLFVDMYIIEFDPLSTNSVDYSTTDLHVIQE